ncbi:MAG: transposase, partial [Clostridiales bacterium]
VDPEVSEAVERLDIMYLNEKEQEIYEAEEKFRRDQYEIMRTAISKANRKGMEEGLKEGMEKGVKKGLKEGMEKGRKEGIEEGKKSEKIEIAKSLLDILDVDTIAEKTGLSIEEVNGLKDDRLI